MRVYRLLLHLYPSSFRAEYGEEMRAIFTKKWREASSALPRLGLFLSAFADVLGNALRAHAELLRQDARYTLRTLARSPGFAATIIVVTALGVGATTATFSIADHVLLRPLPFRDPNRLVKLWQGDTHLSYRNELSPANYRDWKRLSTSFEAMGTYGSLSANLVGEGEPARVSGAAVEADLFAVLGARPALGRSPVASDNRAGAPGAVILSDGLWRTRFGGNTGILGRKILLDDEPFTVVGVMPRGFDFPTRDAELWTAIRLDEQNYADRGDTWLYAVAKLKRGVALEQARNEMRLISAQLERAYPKENAHVEAMVNRLRDEISTQSRLLITALFGAALGVLLIACTNLANLLLARALARRKELAVRTAMGAGRQRLARQLITESLILAFAGGVLGLALAAAAVPLAASLIPHSLPISEVPRVDLSMLLFALFLTGVTGIGFGVAPALRACAAAETGALREGPRVGVERRTERLRALLVVAEVTASVALLIGSGLLLRALWRLQSVDPGFRSARVLTMRTTLPLPRYAVAKADSQLPISSVRILAEIVDADTAPRQIQLRVLVGFAAVAFLLAGIGIYGLLAFTVSQRAREIGVRMALGAEAGTILRMVLKQGTLLAAGGVFLGAGLAYAAGRGMQALLAGVSPADLPTFAAAIALSFSMRLFGSLMPALRAARLDPALIMRDE